MIKLILVRHALTVDNQNSRLSGHIDSVISEEGKKQIHKITKYLKNFNIDKIYTTTSSRTKDTIKKLSELKSIDIIEKESLKEISFGDFEGLTFKEIEDKNTNFDITNIDIIVYSIAIANIDLLAFPINKFPIPFFLGVAVLYIITITPSLANIGINMIVQNKLLFIMLYINPIFNKIKNITAKREFVPNLESFIISSILSLSL